MAALSRPLEDGAAVIVFAVIDFAVAVEDVLWQQAGPGRGLLAHQEMVMVGKEDVGGDGDLVFAAVLFQPGQDVQVVGGVVADGEAAAASIVEVVVGYFCISPQTR